MCNLYSLKTTRAHIADLFGVAPGASGSVPEEVYPRRLAPVVRMAGPEPAAGRVLEDMRWGVPPPAGAGKARPPVTNVRNLASPFWRSALSNPARRCLVPATAFCEWEGTPGRKVKRWFRIPSQPVFAFAGLWRPGEDGPRFAFLTCEPNALVAPVHPKAMPVILHAEDHGRWLEAPWEEAKALAAPYPSQLMALDAPGFGTAQGDEGQRRLEPF